jgi:hypothetical protein
VLEQGDTFYVSSKEVAGVEASATAAATALDWAPLAMIGVGVILFIAVAVDVGKEMKSELREGHIVSSSSKRD